MKPKLIIPFLMLVLIAAVSGIAQPNEPKPLCKQMPFIEELNLTDDQATQLKLLKLDMKKEHILHIAEVKKTRDKIKDELLKEKPSQNSLNGYAKELGKLHGELEKKRLGHFLKVKEALNKEQFEKLLSKESLREMHKYKKHCKCK